MMNKKKLIAYVFVSIMILSAFAGLASYIPGQNNQNNIHIINNYTGTNGTTLYAYYGTSVTFPELASNTLSNTITGCAEKTTTSTSGYPSPDYPPYPSPDYQATASSWTLDLGSYELTDGTSSTNILCENSTYSQSYHHREIKISSTETEYETLAYSYTYATTNWTDVKSLSYDFSTNGTTSGSEYAWTLSLDGVSENGNIYIYSQSPSVSISPSSATIDVGQALQLGTSISSGSGGYSYSWTSSLSGTFSSTSSPDPTWTPSESGTATLKVTVTENGGYTFSNTSTITVDPALSISISETHNPSDEGQDITYDTSVSGGSGDYTSYSYVLYDGTSTSDSELASGTTSSFTYTYDSTGSYLLDYSVTDSNGNTVSTSLTQTVNTDATVSISSSQNPTDVGKTVEFTSSVSGGTQPYNLTWSINGNSYYTKDVNVSFSASGSYTIELTVRDAADYSVDTSMSETVHSDPVVSVSSNVSSADVNYPIEFSASPSGGTGPYSNSWALNGNVISTSQDFSHAFSSPGTYTLTDTLTDSVGETYSASVSVVINPNPSVTISSSQNPTDSGNSVYFSSSISGGTGTDTYSWTINNVVVSTSSSFYYSFNTTGIFSVNLTVTDSA